jgi:hypothetical protein
MELSVQIRLSGVAAPLAKAATPLRVCMAGLRGAHWPILRNFEDDRILGYTRNSPVKLYVYALELILRRTIY